MSSGAVVLPWPKNRYSREIHEIDLQFDHVISCNIELRFDIDAARGICASRAHVADRSRCRMISHDRTADQSHEYLGCNDFLARVVDWKRDYHMSHVCNHGTDQSDRRMNVARFCDLTCTLELWTGTCFASTESADSSHVRLQISALGRIFAISHG